jgi:hypothetical protein
MKGEKNMNLKSLKTKPIVFALIVFMVVPMLLAAVSVARATPVGTVSAVLSGTTSQTNILGQGVGSQFTVDIRADNVPTTTNGINGYSYAVSWDPTVLSLNNVNDPASFFGSSSYSRYVTAVDINSTNSKLIVNDIIIDTSAPSAGVSGTSGILSQLTFEVISAGRCNINLAPSGSGIAYMSTVVSGTSTDVNMNGISALYNPTTSVSLYQNGTSSSTVQVPTGTNPIGSTINVAAVMNNPLSANIWGWNLGVTWNPAVLQLNSVNEGTYLNPTPGLYSGSATLFVVGNINNQVGTIQQGISDVYLTNTTQNAASGTLCVLTFTVLQWANSNINLTQGIPTLLDQYGNPISTLINNATYVTQAPPTPTAPVAVLHNDTPLSSGQTYYAPNATIQLDGLNSSPGVDVVPNANSPSFPITQYTWAVTAQGNVPLTIPTSGNSITFQAPNVQALTTYTISLTVATAANLGDSRYVNTSAAVTITFAVGPLAVQPNGNGAQIDLIVVNPVPSTTTYPAVNPWGYGPNNPADAFAPQQLMQLAAFVSYNGGSVADKLVTFTVGNSTNVVATFVAYTNASGYAVALYRLPNYASSTMLFGEYTVNASVDIAQNYAIDTMPFQYNYILNLATPTLAANSVNEGSTLQMNEVITSTSNATQNYYLVVTVTDCNNVPVFSFQQSGVANGVASATYDQASSMSVNTAINNVALNIPIWAFAGTATVHVDLFNANPQVGSADALPFCPEATQTFTITIPPGENPV